MSYKVEVLADSVSPDGVRLTTLLCVYPRFIHSEMLRHRMFSHSVASSRAIPTERLIEQVREDPFVPETFNKRVKGMGVGEEFNKNDALLAGTAWHQAAHYAADQAEALMNIGLDKSRANRLLEPFLYVSDIISATEWSNFFALRDHFAAQPEFQKLARMMREVMEESEPQELDYGWWHLPLVSPGERWEHGDLGPVAPWDHWKKISASRCARVSFDKHSKYEESEKTLERAERLMQSGHLSPFEHVARPLEDSEGEYQPGVGYWCGNFMGWKQMRKEFDHEHDFGEYLRAVEA